MAVFACAVVENRFNRRDENVRLDREARTAVRYSESVSTLNQSVQRIAAEGGKYEDRGRRRERHRTCTRSALGQSAGPFPEDGRGSGGDGHTPRIGARCPSEVLRR
jgi:hypothetical protein